MKYSIQFPEVETQRLAVKLSPAAEKMVKRGHPWIYDKGVRKVSGTPKSGDLAIIFDSKTNKFLAVGLHDVSSPICIKILAQQPSTINEDWFFNTVQDAYQLRKPLLQSDTDSYRLLYGENDRLPGCICDVYKDIAVVKLYSWIWIPYLKWILEAIVATTNCKAIVIRLSRNLQRKKHPLLKLNDGQVVYGKLDNPVVIFKEYGVRFSANVIEGHKTGYFLDHRQNRREVGQLSRGKKVLDVFAYAGGFSVHALAGGAREVTSIDISQQALDLALENAKLNSHQGTHKVIAKDAFEVLEDLYTSKEKFDIVVIDPPSFAKRELEVNTALHQYKQLAFLGSRLVKRGGLLILASCTARVSAEDFFMVSEAALVEANIPFKVMKKTKHDIDHPVTFDEGAYLKCGYYQL